MKLFTDVSNRRRQEWESGRHPVRETKGKGPAKSRNSPGNEPVKANTKRSVMQRLPGTTSLRELKKVHPQAGPAKFLLLARVVDYHPANIEDFTSLYCSSCGRE